jgi:hypothetical protein
LIRSILDRNLDDEFLRLGEYTHSLYGIVSLHAKQPANDPYLVTGKSLDFGLLCLGQADRANPVALLQQRAFLLGVLLVSNLVADLICESLASAAMPLFSNLYVSTAAGYQLMINHTRSNTSINFES